MRLRTAAGAAFLLCCLSWAQEKSALPKSITVPAMIDHNRVVIHVEVPLPDGSTVRVHAWVDTGDPELNLSRHLATLLALPVTCDERECSSPPPKKVSTRWRVRSKN